MTVDERIENFLRNICQLTLANGFVEVDSLDIITLKSLMREIVKECEPELPATFAKLDDFGVKMYKKGTDEYESNYIDLNHAGHNFGFLTEEQALAEGANSTQLAEVKSNFETVQWNLVRIERNNKLRLS